MKIYYRIIILFGYYEKMKKMMKIVSWCNMKCIRMLNGNNNSMILVNNEDEKVF